MADEKPWLLHADFMSMAYDVLVASSNEAKIDEIRDMLAEYPRLAGLRVRSPREMPDAPPHIDESGATFSDNAQLKALAYATAYGLPALADDSGLCVDALNGEPGVRSARWAGPGDDDRNRALLDRLRDVPDPERGASFVCALCLALPDGAIIEAEAVCRGRILREAAGACGFGYDPLFLVPELGRTMAEMTRREKNTMSHRALAFAALSADLHRLVGTLR